MRPRVNKFATLNARHLGVPLQLTWYKDLELKNFVKLTSMWEKGEEIKPTFVITGNVRIEGGYVFIFMLFCFVSFSFSFL